MMGRLQPIEEQGIETLKEGIYLRLTKLGELLGPEDTAIYVRQIADAMERELSE
jgi:hypothetical protein